MFKNYFKVALRNFWGNRLFSVVNIAGLAVGISASLVIWLLVAYDFSFDKFQKKGDRIYRVVSNFSYSGEDFKSAGVPFPMYNAVRTELSGIDEAAALLLMHGGYRGIKVSIPNAKEKNPAIFRKQQHITFADAHYFKLIEYQWLAGSPETSLKQPYRVVLTASNAKLYFPNFSAEQIIGKEVYFDDTVRTIVTGVVKDIEENTDFTFKTFVSRATLETKRMMPDVWESWGTTEPASQLFIRVAPGANAANVTAQLTKLIQKYIKPDASRRMKATFGLQPLSDIHFNAAYDNFNPRVANKPALYGLLAVAAFLLLLGCINFINLTTAQASRRAKEIGVRKTMGSSKKQLLLQFLSETFLLTLAATLLSAGVTPLLLKAFAGFVPQGFHVNVFQQPGILLFLLTLAVSVSLLAGFYPALILSSYKPALVLKGQSAAAMGKTQSVWFRKALIVSQFVIAQVFIIATVLVGKQINYLLTANMGFNKNAVLYFNTNYNHTASQPFVLRDKLKAIPEIAMVSLSNAPASLDGGIRGDNLLYNDGGKEIATHVSVELADTNYIHLYQLKLLAGKNLPNSDTISSVLINEAYAHALGFKDPQKAIGKYLGWNSWGNKQVPIVGVVQDYHLRSLHEAIKPIVISSKVNEHLLFNIALRPQNADGTTWKNAIAKMQKAFAEVYPEDVLEYSFMDETIAKYYAAEESISRLLWWATALSMFISSLGLLGLVVYITNLRIKETGIRKVLGATTAQLVALLSKDFIQLVITAFVIAVPVAWYGANKWLEGFAYKTTLSWWVFVAGGVVMLLTALLILGARTVKAAMANPVKALRAE